MTNSQLLAMCFFGVPIAVVSYGVGYFQGFCNAGEVLKNYIRSLKKEGGYGE